MQLPASEIETVLSNGEIRNKSVLVESQDLLHFHNLAIARHAQRTKWALSLLCS